MKLLTVTVAFLTALLLIAIGAGLAMADEDARSKAYHHAGGADPSGVIFRAAVDGLRPDIRTGRILAMLDISPSSIPGLAGCPSPQSVGVPAHWVEVGPADEPAVAAAFSVLKAAAVHGLIVFVEVEPAHKGTGASGWCRLNGATLRPRSRDKLPKKAEDR